MNIQFIPIEIKSLHVFHLQGNQFLIDFAVHYTSAQPKNVLLHCDHTKYTHTNTIPSIVWLNQRNVKIIGTKIHIRCPYINGETRTTRK